jgi:hypothetical protein
MKFLYLTSSPENIRLHTHTHQIMPLSLSPSLSLSLSLFLSPTHNLSSTVLAVVLCIFQSVYSKIRESKYNNQCDYHDNRDWKCVCLFVTRLKTTIAPYVTDFVILGTARSETTNVRTANWLSDYKQIRDNKCNYSKFDFLSTTRLETKSATTVSLTF